MAGKKEDKKKSRKSEKKVFGGLGGRMHQTGGAPGSSKAEKRKREENASKVILQKRSRSEAPDCTQPEAGPSSCVSSSSPPRQPLNFKFIAGEYQKVLVIQGLDYERALFAIARLLGARKSLKEQWKLLPTTTKGGGLPEALKAGDGGFHWAYVTNYYWVDENAKSKYTKLRLKGHKEWAALQPYEEDDEQTAKEKAKKIKTIGHGILGTFEEVLRRLFKLGKFKSLGSALLVKLAEALDPNLVYHLGEEILKDANMTFWKNWRVWCQNISLDERFFTEDGYLFAVKGSGNIEDSETYRDHYDQRDRYVWKNVELEYGTRSKCLESGNTPFHLPVLVPTTSRASASSSRYFNTSSNHSGDLSHEKVDENSDINQTGTAQKSEEQEMEKLTRSQCGKKRTEEEEMEEQRKYAMEMDAFRKTLDGVTLLECTAMKENNAKKVRALTTEVRQLDTRIGTVNDELVLRRAMDEALTQRDFHLTEDKKRKKRFEKVCKDPRVAERCSTEVINICSETAELKKGKDIFLGKVSEFISRYKTMQASKQPNATSTGTQGKGDASSAVDSSGAGSEDGPQKLSSSSQGAKSDTGTTIPPENAITSNQDANEVESTVTEETDGVVGEGDGLPTDKVELEEETVKEVPSAVDNADETTDTEIEMPISEKMGKGNHADEGRNEWMDASTTADQLDNVDQISGGLDVSESGRGTSNLELGAPDGGRVVSEVEKEFLSKPGRSAGEVQLITGFANTASFVSFSDLAIAGHAAGGLLPREEEIVTAAEAPEGPGSSGCEVGVNQATSSVKDSGVDPNADDSGIGGGTSVLDDTGDSIDPVKRLNDAVERAMKAREEVEREDRGESREEELREGEETQ